MKLLKLTRGHIIALLFALAIFIVGLIAGLIKEAKDKESK